MNWFFKRSPTPNIQLHIELHCPMCAQTVPGVKKVRVDLKRRQVAIAADPLVKITSLLEALAPTGYRAEPISPPSIFLKFDLPKTNFLT